MRKILFVLLVLFPFMLFSQTVDSLQSNVDSLKFNVDSLQSNVDSLQFDLSKTQVRFTEYQRDSLINDISLSLEKIRMQMLLKSEQSRYKIYKTENIYNLLKLDTWTGRIEQVQWGLHGDYEGTMVVNNADLSWFNDSCFELYSTKNMYQFILLDKANGRTWHVQWGHKDSERWIRRIY